MIRILLALLMFVSVAQAQFWHKNALMKADTAEFLIYTKSLIAGGGLQWYDTTKSNPHSLATNYDLSLLGGGGLQWTDTTKSNPHSLGTNYDLALKLAIADTSYLHNQIILKLAISDTSYLHNQIILKAPIADPGFTGTVTIPENFKLGATTVTPTGAEFNFVDGVTSAIQGQIDGKQASLGFTPEDAAKKNAASGYAGLTASTKIDAAQATEVLGVSDLSDFASKSGSGTAAIGTTLTAVAQGDILYYSGTDWVNLGSGTAGKFLQTQGVGNPVWANAPIYVRKTANQTINAGAGTYVNVTDLTFTVKNGTDYAFHFYITFQSAAATTGWRAGVNCPAGTLDFWEKDQTIANGAAGVATHTERHNVTRDDMTLLTATVTQAVDLSVVIEGRYMCTADGTFAVRFANELTPNTDIVVQKGSWGWYF